MFNVTMKSIRNDEKNEKIYLKKDQIADENPKKFRQISSEICVK